MNKSVLIIEDDAVQCETLCKLLALQGIKSECASNFREGLRISNDRVFDLAIVDLNLPDSKSTDTVVKLDQLGLRVIAITGVDDPDLIRHFKHQEIPFILKPVVTRDFLQTVLTELEYKEPSEEIERKIIATAKLPIAPEMSSGSRLRAWIAPACAVAACLFLVVDHAGGALGIWRDSKVESQSMRTDINQTKERVTALETATNEHFKELKGGIDNLRSDMATVQQQNSLSIGERGDLKREVGSMHSTIDNIYTILTKR